jgi:hypothetical protein
MSVIRKISTTLLIILASGCGNSLSPLHNGEEKSNPKSNQSIRPHSEISMSGLRRTWNIKYSSKCSEADPTQCIGGYGFTASSDGTFTVGPGPEGQTFSGTLTNDEMKTLRTYFAQIQLNDDSSSAELREVREVQPSPSPLPSSSPNPTASPIVGNPATSERETCVQNEGSNNTEVIEFRYKNFIKAKIRSSKSEFCFRSITQSIAEDLAGSVHSILTKYYPDKFPNDCINASHSFENFCKTLTKCERDSDCSYLGEDFLPISTDHLDEVITDDCTYIKPLIVSNAFHAVSHQLQLLEMRDLAQQVCKEKDAKRNSCNQVKRLKSSKISPVCSRGVCTLHPFMKTK